MSAQNFFNYEDITRINLDLKLEYKKLEIINEDIIKMCKEISDGSVWNGIGSNNFSEKLKNNVEKFKVDLKAIDEFSSKLYTVSNELSNAETRSSAHLNIALGAVTSVASFADNTVNNFTKTVGEVFQNAKFNITSGISNSGGDITATDSNADEININNQGLAQEESADFYAANGGSNTINSTASSSNASASPANASPIKDNDDDEEKDNTTMDGRGGGSYTL